MDASSSDSATASDSVFASAEFQEYEREFRQYCADNLRSHNPQTDFDSIRRDSAEDLAAKLAVLSQWWRSAAHVVVFTGAGISTSSGLPDYRGPSGIWTRKVRGETVSESLDLRGIEPTPAHGALTRLYQAGKLALVATTNDDSLHGKAGLPKHALVELHGNLFVEECAQCGARYERPFKVRTATGLFEHATGRPCEKCGGPLRDNLVNFGNTFEHVPSMEAEHDRAWVAMLKADLVVVLGSSLSVPTACDLPEECIPPREAKPAGGRLVIVSFQNTPKDPLAALHIFAPCDDVMAAVEAALLPAAPTPERLSVDA